MNFKSLFSSKSKTLTVICLIFSFLIGIYLISDVFFFSDAYEKNPPVVYFILLSLFAVLTTGVFVFNNRSEEPIKENLYFGIGLSGLVLINMLCILSFKRHIDFSITGIDGEIYSGSYDVTIFEKVKYFFNFSIIGLFVYQLFVYYPRLSKDETVILLFVFAIIGLVATITLISYITEYSKYYKFIHYFKTHGSYNFVLNPLGLHKNVYGFLLTLQIFCLLYLFSKFKKWYILPIILFSYLNMIFTLCKAGLIISLVAVLAYLVYLYIATFNTNKKRSFIILSILGGLVLVFCVLLIISFALPNSPLGKARDNVYLLFKMGESMNTLKSRTLIWNNSFAILSSSVKSFLNNYLFGCGSGTFGGLLRQYNLADPNVAWFNKTSQAHNAWIQCLCEGGALRVICALSLIVYLFIINIKNWKFNRDLSFYSFIILTMGLAYGMLENYPIVFSQSAETTALSFLIIVPIIHNKTLTVNSQQTM